MKMFLPLCFASSLLLLGNQAFGQEGAQQDRESAEKRSAEETAKSSTDSKSQKSKNKSKDKEIFIPSEEISEDFAVSFPVDI